MNTTQSKAMVSTQISPTTEKSRVIVKFDPAAFGLDWNLGDTIRVISNKTKQTLELVKVPRKYKKQVAFTLTSTGSGSFAFNKGLFVRKPTQSKHTLVPVKFDPVNQSLTIKVNEATLA
jgi:hypothetical protein